jgi:hypothetical protein
MSRRRPAGPPSVTDPALPLPTAIGAPATRALAAAGITDLRDLAGRTEGEVLTWHGVGPKAVGRLREAMAASGLTFAG